MVCLGNICRSPLAEGIMRQKIENAGVKWQVDSAGTGGYHLGSQPHKSSQKIALVHGIDISNQKARLFTKNDLLNFDKIYVMDGANYEDVKKMSGEDWDHQKVEFLLNEVTPGKNANVPDPYFGGEDGFENVFNMINEACDFIVHRYGMVNNPINNNDKTSLG